MDSHISTQLPEYLKRYFWGDDLTDLTLQRNSSYIIQVVLERGDNQALHWLFSTFSKQTIKNILPKMRLSKKSEVFWNVYLS